MESQFDVLTAALRMAAFYCTASFVVATTAALLVWSVRAWRYWVLVIRRTRRASAARREAEALREKALRDAAAYQWSAMLAEHPAPPSESNSARGQ